MYPSELKRVVYMYTTFGEKKKILFDWSDIQYFYHPHSNMLHSIQLYNPVPFKYNCTLVFEPGDALVKSQSVRFHGEDISLINANFGYQYDTSFRVAIFDSTIGKKHFHAYNISYDSNTGRLVKLKEFSFEYPGLDKDIIKDSNIEVTREYDGFGRLTASFYKFNNYVGCSMEINYDSLNRVHNWRRKVGSSDLKSYDFIYDIDGNMIEVLVNGQIEWGYEVDPNSNIIQITHHQKTTEIEINGKNQVEISRSNSEKSYIFNKDGFLVQRDKEVFEYNALGQLGRAFEVGKYDIHYFYDPLGHLVARSDVMGGYTTQFFYGDIERKDRITHIYDHTSKVYTTFYYDNHGKLFAMERDGISYYIILDPMGSPILLLNSVGSVVKQMSYDPLGQIVSDSAPDFSFLLGYQSGVVDHITELLFLGGEVYDPILGRRTAPNYQHLLRNIETIMDHPESLNLYRHNLVRYPKIEDNLMSGK